MAVRTIPPSEASARQQALALAFETAKTQNAGRAVSTQSVLEAAAAYLDFLSPKQSEDN
jgi:hypothetical protein